MYLLIFCLFIKYIYNIKYKYIYLLKYLRVPTSFISLIYENLAV